MSPPSPPCTAPLYGPLCAPGGVSHSSENSPAPSPRFFHGLFCPRLFTPTPRRGENDKMIEIETDPIATGYRQASRRGLDGLPLPLALSLSSARHGARPRQSSRTLAQIIQEIRFPRPGAVRRSVRLLARRHLSARRARTLDGDSATSAERGSGGRWGPGERGGDCAAASASARPRQPPYVAPPGRDVSGAGAKPTACSILVDGATKVHAEMPTASYASVSTKCCTPAAATGHRRRPVLWSPHL